MKKNWYNTLLTLSFVRFFHCVSSYLCSYFLFLSRTVFQFIFHIGTQIDGKFEKKSFREFLIRNIFPFIYLPRETFEERENGGF